MKDRKYRIAFINKEDGSELDPPSNYRGALVNIETGKAIPEDEPTFIVRAKDQIAVEVPAHYRSRAAVYGCPQSIFTSVEHCIADMNEWRRQNHESVKMPD